jgi:hypothetical protein
MDQEQLRYYEELRAYLSPLRRLLMEDDASMSFFEEFLEHNEFGLALQTICDSLFEREDKSIEESDLETIKFLFTRMQMNDEYVFQLKKHNSVLCNRARL